jgi:hypothetical protein
MVLRKNIAANQRRTPLASLPTHAFPPFDVQRRDLLVAAVARLARVVLVRRAPRCTFVKSR